MNKFKLVLIFLLIVFPATNALAAVPPFLNYQGTVKDNMGVPVNGTAYFKFAIVNQGGSVAYWLNNGDPNTDYPSNIANINAVTITVTDGVFSVKLGYNSLANMAPLTQSVFDNAAIYLRVWFSTTNSNFEQFNNDIQIVSSGFAFKAGAADVANTVTDSAVTSVTIQDNTITNADISGAAAIAASKIDRTNLDADTLDGIDSSGFALASHVHNYAGSSSPGGPANDLNCTFCVSSAEIDPTGLNADTLDGIDSTGFALSTHTHGDWTVSGANVYSVVSGNVGIGTTAPTSKLDVNGTVKGSAFQYNAPQTRYLQLAGGQCVHQYPGVAFNAHQTFYCDLGDDLSLGSTSPAFWSVNIPNGASLVELQVRLYTGAATTTCALSYGSNGSGTIIGDVTETFALGSTDTWHFVNKLISHVVDTKNNAYGIECSNNDTGGSPGTAIGSIRIQYTVPSPN